MRVCMLEAHVYLYSTSSIEPGKKKEEHVLVWWCLDLCTLYKHLPTAGRVVASFDSEDPSENMLAGALPGGGGSRGDRDATGISLTELLEFVGLPSDSWDASDVQVNRMQFGGSRLFVGTWLRREVFF